MCSHEFILSPSPSEFKEYTIPNLLTHVGPNEVHFKKYKEKGIWFWTFKKGKQNSYF